MVPFRGHCSLMFSACSEAARQPPVSLRKINFSQFKKINNSLWLFNIYES